MTQRFENNTNMYEKVKKCNAMQRVNGGRTKQIRRLKIKTRQ